MDRELEIGMKAYQSMYQSEEIVETEELNEASPSFTVSGGASKFAKPVLPGEQRLTPEMQKPNLNVQGSQKLIKQASAKPTTQVAHFDMYDAVLNYLISEGYAETEENALVIMSNMSEEWRNSILKNL